MSSVIRAVLIVFLFLQVEPTWAQRLGLLPSNIKWHQLRHDSLRVIYPAGSEASAQRVASLILKLARVDPITLKCRYKPISVILQPQTNISNGYVGLAPYVSEFYLEPHENPFQIGSLPWTELLALHEYRHVQQLNAANNGISHLVKLVFGDLVFSGLYALSVPNWYREGDAVYAESKWTLQGRGRISNFVLPFYQKAMEGVPWNYYKVRNGSYKEFTPDYYPLGYLLVQYGNHIFGEATWDTIVHTAPRFRYLFRPFSGLVRENYGTRISGFYLDAMEWYADKWTSTLGENMEYPSIPLRQKDLDNDYFDMTYPVLDRDGNIYTSITTFDHTTAICKLKPGGGYDKIRSTGFQKDSYFDFSHDRFVWTELRYDPRWIRKDKNVIVLYDQKKRTRKTLEPEKGYFTPSLNEAGDKIVAVHENKSGQYALRIIDADARSVITELPNPENFYLGYPTFSEDEQSIIATVRNKAGQMCLIEQNVLSGQIRFITYYSYAVLGRPVIHGSWIFLTTGLSTIEQVFAVDREDGIFYQVSDGRNAHFDPAWDPVHDELICSEYQLDGKKLVRLPAKPEAWRPVNLEDGIKELPGYTGRNLIADVKDEEKFTIKKYSSWANAINPHSWVVTANDPYYGVEVRSDNILNTVAIAGGYEFNRNTKASGPYLNAVFGMWFPQLKVGISNVSQEIELSDGREARAVNNQYIAGVSVPLFFTPGLYRQDFVVAADYHAGISMLRPKLVEYEDIKFNYGTYQMTLINSRKQAYRQSLPSFGQRLDVSYSHEFSGASISQFYSSADLAFPALRPSHFLVFHGEVLIQDINDESIQLRSDYIGPRGFAFTNGQTQYRMGVTYGFPLFYPDKGIGNILYTRRIRLQPFFDYGYTNDEDAPSSFRSSTGAELIFDFHFPPISLGIRYSRLISGYTGGADQFELFIPSPRF